MMFWNGNGAWAWMMIPMMLAMWAVIALVILPWVRTDRDRSPFDQLNDRLASGEITVEEHRSRRDELQRRTPV